MFEYKTIDMVATGENILRLRKENGITVKELQKIFGFSTPQAIYKWQHGASIPNIDNLVILASIFDVHLEDILEIKCLE